MSRSQSPELPPTEDHQRPSLDPPTRGRPCFIVAFPGSRAIPLPTLDESVGREWFQQNGVDDTEISRSHIRVSRRGAELQLADAGSRNGLWLDGQLVLGSASATLDDGALVRVGRTLLVFRADWEGESIPASSLGDLVGPFGLRAAASFVERLVQRPPRSVLIEGETGTGKELLAKEIAGRLRPKKPLEAVNVPGIPSALFESVLFGHAAGAFSGAAKAQPGIVGRNEGGTVFLDELGELPLELQPKLLRLLENGELATVGAPPRPANVLLIAATNRSLEQEVAAGRFRADLLARFRDARVELPALRDRREDVFPIVHALLAARGETIDTAQTDVEAAERLLLHAWPGNVRELEATLARIGALQPYPMLKLWTVEQVLGPREAAALELTSERVEAALHRFGGNRTAAAAALGVTRGKLLRYLRR